MRLIVTRGLRQADFQTAGVAARVTFNHKTAIGCPPGQFPVVRMKETVEAEKPHGCVSYFRLPEFNNAMAVIVSWCIYQEPVAERMPAPDPYSKPADLMCQKLKKVSPDFADFCKKISERQNRATVSAP